MKILLLTVGLVLVFGIKACPNNLEDPKALSGRWYTISVCANVTSKIEEGGEFRIFMRYFTVHDDNNISGTIYRRENGKCIKIHLSTYFGNDGERHFLYEGNNKFITESEIHQYAMFSIKNVKNKETTSWGVLYGRTPNLSKEIKKKFEKMCIKIGTDKDQVRDLSNDDRCEMCS